MLIKQRQKAQTRTDEKPILKDKSWLLSKQAESNR